MDHFFPNSDSKNERAPALRQPEVRIAHGEYLSGPAVPVRAAGTEDAQSELLTYWHIVQRHKGTIALFAFSFALLGFLIGLPMKPVYRARTALEVLTLNEDFLNMRQANPTSSFDPNSDTSELQTQATLLESAALQESVNAQLDDKPRLKKPLKAGSGGFNWRRLLRLEPDPRTPRETLIDKAVDSLKVRALPRTRIIEVTVDSTDPQFATEYASLLAEKFIHSNLENQWATTEKTSEWLAREIQDARAKLEHSEEALQKYAGSSGLIFSNQDEQTTLGTEKLQQVQYQLSAATSDRIQKQSRYELAQHSPPDSLPDVLIDTPLREAQARITELRRQIAHMSAVFTPEYSKLKQAQAELAELQTAFQRDRASIVQRIKNEYQDSSRREQLLLAEYNSQAKEVTGQGEKAVQYNVLRREVEGNRKLYDTMLVQLKQSNIASALGASKVRIIDPAETYPMPVRPNYKLNTAIGVVAGLFFGIVFVLMRDQTDRSLREPGDTQLWTSLPELGAIPNAALNRKQAIYGRAVAARLIGDSSKKPEAPRPQGTPSELLIEGTKPGLLSEAIRSVVTSILFADGETQERPRVLVITSPEPGDGKTTIASHLGVALSEIQGNVLLIDADLRRPKLDNIFNLSNERGLSDLLRDVPVKPHTLDGLIQQTAVPGLHVLTSGPAVPGATSLFYSLAFAELLRIVRAEYSMVLIDTPPMLQMTDARVIGRLADAVVLVARAAQTTRDALIAAHQRFTVDNVRVLGTIFNDWNPRNSSSPFYGKRKNGILSYLAEDEKKSNFTAASSD